MSKPFTELEQELFHKIQIYQATCEQCLRIIDNTFVCEEDIQEIAEVLREALKSAKVEN